MAPSLLEECIKYFQNKNYNFIDLEVYKSNKKAVAFYQKYNFKIQGQKNKKLLVMRKKLERDYNEEFKDTKTHKYAYNFDFNVMHSYMIKSFKSYFVNGNCLELGSFKGDFTKRLLPYFEYITCVEASSDAIREAQSKIGNKVRWIEGKFEDIKLPTKYDNIIITHVLEHINEPVALLNKIKEEWLTDNGKLFIVVPNANAPSRQIAVKMGLIPYNTSITPREKEQGHHITYTLDVLDSHAKQAGLNVIHRSGIFFKALANFQWDRLLETDIINKDYLDGCYALGQQYPDLCSSIMLVCKK
jgi:2-polyprenyl-3-methyl-5-hydroxy-6-metoxy-1,4-benzoquinol methylase